MMDRFLDYIAQLQLPGHLSGAVFLYPWAFLLLLALPVYLTLRFYYIRRSAAPLPSIQHHPSQRISLSLPGLLLVESLLLASLITAIAAPGKEDTIQSISEEGIDMALVLDISASMMAADFKPTRLESLKKLSGDFVDRSSSDRISVFLFAGEVFTQAPLTTDRLAVKGLLEGISYYMIDHSRSGGTAIGDALLLSADALRSRRIEGRDQALILITDGENDRGIDPEEVIPFLRKEKIHLYIVGMAGDEKAPVLIEGKPFITAGNKPLYTSLDDRSLRGLASSGKGRYYRAKDEDALRAILTEISTLSRTPLEIREIRTRRADAWIFALLALALYLLRQVYLIFAVRRPPL